MEDYLTYRFESGIAFSQAALINVAVEEFHQWNKDNETEIDFGEKYRVQLDSIEKQNILPRGSKLKPFNAPFNSLKIFGEIQLDTEMEIIDVKLDKIQIDVRDCDSDEEKNMKTFVKLIMFDLKTKLHCIIMHRIKVSINEFGSKLMPNKSEKPCDEIGFEFKLEMENVMFAAVSNLSPYLKIFGIFHASCPEKYKMEFKPVNSTVRFHHALPHYSRYFKVIGRHNHHNFHIKFLHGVQYDLNGPKMPKTTEENILKRSKMELKKLKFDTHIGVDKGIKTGRFNQEDINELDQLNPASAAFHLDDIDKLDKLNPASAAFHLDDIDKLDKLNPASAAFHLDDIDKLDKLNPASAAFHLDDIDKLDKLNPASAAFHLDDIDKLDKLNPASAAFNLDDIDKLDKLNPASAAFNLDDIDKLDKLNPASAAFNLDDIDKLDKLNPAKAAFHLDNINELEKHKPDTDSDVDKGIKTARLHLEVINEAKDLYIIEGLKVDCWQTIASKIEKESTDNKVGALFDSIDEYFFSYLDLIQSGLRDPNGPLGGIPNAGQFIYDALAPIVEPLDGILFSLRSSLFNSFHAFISFLSEKFKEIHELVIEGWQNALYKVKSTSKGLYQLPAELTNIMTRLGVKNFYPIGTIFCVVFQSSYAALFSHVMRTILHGMTNHLRFGINIIPKDSCSGSHEVIITPTLEDVLQALTEVILKAVDQLGTFNTCEKQTIPICPKTLFEAYDNLNVWEQLKNVGSIIQNRYCNILQEYQAEHMKILSQLDGIKTKWDELKNETKNAFLGKVRKMISIITDIDEFKRSIDVLLVWRLRLRFLVDCSEVIEYYKRLTNQQRDEMYKYCTETLINAAKSQISTLNEILEYVNSPFQGASELILRRERVIEIQEGELKIATLVLQQIKVFMNECSNIDFSSMIEPMEELKAKVIFVSKQMVEVSNFLFSEKFSLEERIVSESKELCNEVVEFYDTHLKGFRNFRFFDDMESNVIELEDVMNKMASFRERADFLEFQTELLENRPPDFSLAELSQLEYAFEPLINLIMLGRDFDAICKSVLTAPREDVDYETFVKQLDVAFNKFRDLHKWFKSRSKQLVLDQSPFIYEGDMDSPYEENWPTPLKFISDVLEHLRQMKNLCPAIRILTNPYLEPRHWSAIAAVTKVKVGDFKGRNVQSLLDLGLLPYIEKIEAISTAATKEAQIKNAIDEMKREWQNIKLDMKYDDRVNSYIIGSVHEILNTLHDHLDRTLALSGSVFAKFHQEIVDNWKDKLSNIGRILEDWSKVQMQWMYFAPIFSSDDIALQMPVERAIFEEISQAYLQLMKITMDDPRVLILSKNMFCQDVISNALVKLDEVTSGVNSYLEKKRLYFTRFFFLSNDDMLKILSETKEPTKVEPYLSKCFQGISKLAFDPDWNVRAMISSEGEEVKMKNLVNTKEAGGNVETWLLWVEDMMKRSIRECINTAFNEYSTKRRNKWILSFPGQVVLCVSQAIWTSEMHECFRCKRYDSMKIYAEGLTIQLNRLINLVRDVKLTKLNRIILNTLVVLDVHSKEITDQFLAKKIFNATSFDWLSQLRYYLRRKPPSYGSISRVKRRDVEVKMMETSVDYAYEYLGTTPRLVITPLTDRCFRTLIGAYSLHLNGAPEGTAGTGKTETVKDLAKALAVQCIVFNCSQELDCLSICKFFKGIASSGTWVCFEEFNRIEVDVLSVLAQQILTITQAVRNKVKTFQFEGSTLKLNPACYACITMKPGNAGRFELPDNLKVLFRPVAMMVPDYTMIGEISLYSFGFTNARALSAKIVTTHNLCAAQLSSESHYDFGMGAVKSVLSTAGNLKLRFPNEQEDQLVQRAIFDVNLPKLSNYDVPMFQAIMKDLFPAAVMTELSHDELMICSHEVCERLNLKLVEPFMNKIIQTYETMMVRHGFMLVGDPFSGKSSTISVLGGALNFLRDLYNIGNGAIYEVLNPKSVTLAQLYGQLDLVSHEWTDGIISAFYRMYASNRSPERKWIVFDGPVDAVWIENMNTVLDDNKKLCLNSGETIQMNSVMSMIFEVMDLVEASPATVSRCGIIYMESSALGWRPLVETWNESIPPAWLQGRSSERILIYFEWLLPKCLEFCTRNCKRMVYGGNINLVRTSCDLFYLMLNNVTADGKGKKPIGEYFINWIQATVMMAIFWGIGGTLEYSSKIKFDDFFKNLWKTGEGYPPNQIDTELVDTEPIVIIPPSNGLIDDNMFQYAGTGNWVLYSTLLEDEKTPVSSLLVPTVETLKYSYIMKLLVNGRKPFLLTGPTGTGKSVYINDLLLNGIDLEVFAPSVITFTATVTPKTIQETVLSSLTRKGRKHYAPPSGKVGIIFGDDINMPEKEVHGAQPPLELLRQFFDYGFWYDLKSTNMLELSNIFFVAAMGPPGGSRQDIYARFLRHFALLGLNDLQINSTVKIFTEILVTGFQENGFSTELVPFLCDVVRATIAVYSWALENLCPIPAKCHYLFDIRDIGRVIQGFLLLRKESPHEKRDLLRLWTHEILREFYDRLVERKDRLNVLKAIKTSCKVAFRENLDIYLDGLSPHPNRKEVQLRDLESLFFTSALETKSKKYEEIVSYERFLEVMEESINTYNHTHQSGLRIILFKYAVSHLTRIFRIISTPGGQGLLFGISGCGKKSLVKLATHVFEMPLFEPEISKTYGVDAWHDDIKKVLKYVGISNKPHAVLCGDWHIKDERFMQDINLILKTGEVPNIFGIDEVVDIVESVRISAQRGDKNANLSRYKLFSIFQDRCKKNMHLLLCFSPLGDSFRQRIRAYPALINSCTIDWFEDWPKEGLVSIAERSLLSVDIPLDYKKRAIDVLVFFHITSRTSKDSMFRSKGRRVYYTCKTYMDLIENFAAIYKKRKDAVEQTMLKYQNSCQKLKLLETQVTKMQQGIDTLIPTMEDIEREVAGTIEQIAKERNNITHVAAIVKEQENIAIVHAEQFITILEDYEKEIDKLMSIERAATEALHSIKRPDLALLTCMSKPPEAVRAVMAAACVLLGVHPIRVPISYCPGRFVRDYWPPSQRLLGDGFQFLRKLIDFDKDNIPFDRIIKIRSEYLNNEYIDPKSLKKTSPAALGIYKWIMAVDMYDRTLKEATPKKARLEEAEGFSKEAVKKLNESQERLKAIKEKLRNVEYVHAEAQVRLQLLQDDQQKNQEIIKKANYILNSLLGEQIRWKELQNYFEEQLSVLPGDVLLCCGIITYHGPLSMELRENLMALWCRYMKDKKITLRNGFSFRGVLSTELSVMEWVMGGLPNDPFFVNNAVIINSSQKYCLLIDPQYQANRWIKKMCAGNLVVTKLSADYMTQVERACRGGLPLLLEDVCESIDSALEPLLNRQFFTQGGYRYVTFGDRTVKVKEGFTLYITTKLMNPHFSPEIYGQVTVIDFSVTLDGLADRLGNIIISLRYPDLYQKQKQFVTEGSSNKATLERCEMDFFACLQNEDLLTHPEIVPLLDKLKETTRELEDKENEFAVPKRKLFRLTRHYRPIARQSSYLYFSIVNLPSVDPMYQFSLQWFVNIYKEAVITIKDKLINDDQYEFKELFRDELRLSIYQNVSASLFTKDRLLYSFVYALALMEGEGTLNRDELTFLLTGGVAITRKSGPNPDPERKPPSWLPESSWNEICRCGHLEAFAGFKSSFILHSRVWKNFYSKRAPDFKDIPAPWSHGLSYFQQLIIFRILRPEMLIYMMDSFVELEFGAEFISSPQVDLSNTISKCESTKPVIFLLSSGADPVDELMGLAKESGVEFITLPLGRGQGAKAEGILREKCKTDTWLCLQNCHLSASWMPRLEALCEELDGGSMNTSKNFRLFLTSFPSDKFPVTILQQGIKIIIETPPGLKNRLLKFYQSSPVFESRFYSSCYGKEPTFARLLLGISLFHAVVLERRSFGPIGWNVSYDFNDSDYAASITQLQIWLDKHANVPYDAINYFTGECNYGGRVTDEWDRRTLMTLLNDYVSPQLVNNEDYSLYKEDRQFRLPPTYRYHEILNFINLLPDRIPTSFYGLHKNAGIARDIMDTSILQKSLIKVMQIGSANGAGANETVSSIAENILEELPERFNIAENLDKFPPLYSEPMNILLVREMDRYNKLTDCIRSTVQSLIRANKGEIVMTSELQEIANSLLVSKIPGIWFDVSYPSIKPLGSYIRDLIKRLEILDYWSELGKPARFWLPGFFSTQAFLTSILQNYARKRRSEIDRLTFEFRVLDDLESIYVRPEGSVIVFGIHLVGARWSRVRHCLAEQKLKILSADLPHILLEPITKEERVIGQRFICPVYETSERKGTLSTTGQSTNYVLPLLLACTEKRNASHWVKRGVAAILQLDD